MTPDKESDSKDKCLFALRQTNYFEQVQPQLMKSVDAVVNAMVDSRHNDPLLQNGLATLQDLSRDIGNRRGIFAN
jgi:hypothetical protein